MLRSRNKIAHGYCAGSHRSVSNRELLLKLSYLHFDCIQIGFDGQIKSSNTSFAAAFSISPVTTLTYVFWFNSQQLKVELNYLLNTYKSKTYHTFHYFIFFIILFIT